MVYIENLFTFTWLLFFSIFRKIRLKVLKVYIYTFIEFFTIYLLTCSFTRYSTRFVFENKNIYNEPILHFGKCYKNSIHGRSSTSNIFFTDLKTFNFFASAACLLVGWVCLYAYKTDARLIWSEARTRLKNDWNEFQCNSSPLGINRRSR